MSFWAKTPEEAINELSSSKNGLDEEEAGSRLGKYGLNDIPIRKAKIRVKLTLCTSKGPIGK